MGAPHGSSYEAVNGLPALDDAITAISHLSRDCIVIAGSVLI